jgi:hypothetical protein
LTDTLALPPNRIPDMSSFCLPLVKSIAYIVGPLITLRPSLQPSGFSASR